MAINRHFDTKLIMHKAFTPPKIIVATALILLVMDGTIRNYEVIAAITILQAATGLATTSNKNKALTARIRTSILVLADKTNLRMITSVINVAPV